MDKILNFKMALSILISSLIVTISYELKGVWNYETEYFFIIAVIISFVLSNLLAIISSDFLLEYRNIRKIIFGNRDIEGVWIFQSEDEDNNSNLSKQNIVKIKYDNKKNSFKVVGVRIDEKGNEINSNSIFSRYDFKTGDFVNVTNILDNNLGISVSLTYGKFFSDYRSKNINKYHGIILAEGNENPIKIIRNAKRKENIDNKTK